MGKKPSPDSRGYVYSTDPDFSFRDEEPNAVTLPPREQQLRVLLDTRQRAGKAVTIVARFSGKKEDLEALGKQLKTFCGSGGSVKDGEILIQGDHREKVIQWLVRQGYQHTKKSGG